MEPHDASSAKDESQKEAIVSEAAPLEMNLEQSDQLMREVCLSITLNLYSLYLNRFNNHLIARSSFCFLRFAS